MAISKNNFREKKDKRQDFRKKRKRLDDRPDLRPKQVAVPR